MPHGPGRDTASPMPRDQTEARTGTVSAALNQPSGAATPAAMAVGVGPGVMVIGVAFGMYDGSALTRSCGPAVGAKAAGGQACAFRLTFWPAPGPPVAEAASGGVHGC